MSLAERIARAVGLWPVYGRAALLYYTWANDSIDPMHSDAVAVGRRFAALRDEFGPLFPCTRKPQP